MKQLSREAKDVIEIQERADAPKHFVCGSWLPGLYFGNDWFREIDQDIFFNKYLRVLLDLLSRPTVYVNVARLKIDPDTVVGFSVLETTADGEVLHWVYVRRDWRKKGIASNLLPPGITACTHLSKTGRAIKPKSWKFNPFL